MFPLVDLPVDLQLCVLKSLSSRELGVAQACSKGLKRLAMIAADDKLTSMLNTAKEVKRWRYPSLCRLRIEETLSGFSWDPNTQDPADFLLDTTCIGTHIRLEGSGPKMLVSKDSTRGGKMLRWRFQLEGNNAVEFGVVPECLAHDSKALHKCCSCTDYPAEHSSRSTGFCSAITVGSNLPVRLPLMKGSDIEVLCWANRVEFIINQPSEGAMEMVWQNNITLPKPYKGPRRLRFELELTGCEPYKLALTCWAKAHLVSAAPPVSS